ncbi:MAG: glycosyltransferase family 2 protein [Desulfobacteraceae bacterium]|nr:glycosyltransferase family 2 protein [Desulfobacteraceae bacterium]
MTHSNNSEILKNHANKSCHARWMSENYKPCLVSVIIPTYNRAHLIRRAIESVLNQTCQDFEIIVIDDGSIDDTKEVIESFNDERILYIRHNRNKGGAAARNTGIQAAKGEYIAFQDSDDEWLPEKLEKQIEHFTKCSDSVGVVYCSHHTQDDLSGRIWKAPLSDLRRGNVYNFLLNGWCPASTSFFLLARRIFEKSGIFDETLPSFQDYDLWIRVAKHYEFEFVGEPLVIKHEHSGSQVAKDLGPRIKGLALFLDKWGDVIKKEAGVKPFNDIRRMHLSSVCQNAVLDNLSVSQRREAMEYLKRLWKLQLLSLKFLIKVLIALVGGTRLLSLSNRIYRALKHMV